MFELIISTLFFLFGAAIGSFTLVVVTRLHVAPIASSRSKCLSCGEALRVWDLVPIFSYLSLGGSCRYCKTPYGAGSLLIECLFGGLFVLLYHFILSGFLLVPLIAWLGYYTLLFISLGVVALYDYKHSYVPILYLAIFLVLSFAMLAMHYLYAPTSAVLLGPLVVALPFLSVWIITKGRGLGLGDVLLYAGVGAFFGIEQGLAVLLVSVWIGAIVGAYVYIKSFKHHTKSKAMPFVPFIVVAFLVVLFTDIDVFSIASIFS